MTPDEARDLLDGTTPAEDWWYSVKGGWVRHLDPVGIDAAGELDVSEDDAALIVAAPALAAMRAEMREEWGVSLPDGQLVGAGWGTHDTALEDMNAWRRDGYDARIVRRYVTTEEEA